LFGFLTLVLSAIIIHFGKSFANSLIIWQFISTPDFMFSPAHYVMGLYEKQENQ
jgi:hypothetical protein